MASCATVHILNTLDSRNNTGAVKRNPIGKATIPEDSPRVGSSGGDLSNATLALCSAKTSKT